MFPNAMGIWIHLLIAKSVGQLIRQPRAKFLDFKALSLPPIFKELATNSKSGAEGSVRS